MMSNHSNHRPFDTEHLDNGDPHTPVDYTWFDRRFESLGERLAAMEDTISAMEQTVSTAPSQPTTREYYSVPEFAIEVERGEYTVREWCRLGRITAEKCETGRGDAKSWKIPVEELQRYRDHGLLPARYLH